MKTELRGKTLVMTPTLEATCHHVGERLGLTREPSETIEAYRARLIATGKVASIEAGAVRLVGEVKLVTMEMGLSMGEGREREQGG